MALNGTQKNIIEGVLNTYIDDILVLNKKEALNALNALLIGDISSNEYTLFEKQCIAEDIKVIHDILTHPCPQNRAVSYAYFGAPADPNMIVYKNEQGKPAFEQRGLLGLTSRNDSETSPPTKEDVVAYTHELIIAAIQLKNSDPSTETSSTSVGFFKDSVDSDIIKQIKMMLTADELRVIPILTLLRLPTGKRLSFCQSMRDWRYEPPPDELYFGSGNEFRAGIEALLIRGVTLDKFLSFSQEKQVLLATEDLTWRFMDIGMDFEKLSQLEIQDVEEIFSRVKSDVSKLLSMCGDNKEELGQEINALIESKLNPLSASSDM